MLSGRSATNPRSHNRAKSFSGVRKSVANNEFLNKQLDPSKIEEYM